MLNLTDGRTPRSLKAVTKVALLRSKGAMLNPLVLVEVAILRAYLHMYSQP